MPGASFHSVFIGTAAALAAVWLSLATAAGAETAGPACWTADALRGAANEKTIVKDTPKAIVDPPSAPLAALPAAPRGAIRRVALPAGIKRMALTFDLCEQPYEVAGYDAELVDVLRSQNAKATFFAGGKWMLTHAERTAQLLADPLFEVGNHAWEHRNLRLLQGQRQEDEIGWAERAYAKVAGDLGRRNCVARDGRPVSPPTRMTLFRFPFGACNPEALDAVARLGMLPIQWDISSGDPMKTLTGEQMAAAVLARVRPGSIVLFHANGRGWTTAEALKILIPALRAKGYEIVTVGELLATPGASFTRDPVCYDAKPGDVDRHDELARKLDAAYERFYQRFAPERARSPAPAAPPAPETAP